MELAQALLVQLATRGSSASAWRLVFGIEYRATIAPVLVLSRSAHEVGVAGAAFVQMSVVSSPDVSSGSVVGAPISRSTVPFAKTSRASLLRFCEVAPVGTTLMVESVTLGPKSATIVQVLDPDNGVATFWTMPPEVKYTAGLLPVPKSRLAS